MRTEKVVLIAGGAGSIGSALAERLAKAGGNDLVLIDKDENRLRGTEAIASRVRGTRLRLHTWPT